MKQHNLSNEQLRALMDEEARAAEAAAEADVDDGAPLPAHVTVSRPNRARSRVLQVRLNPDEFEALEHIAAARGLPPSTVARDWLLRLLAQDASQRPDVAALSATAQALADGLRELEGMGLIGSSSTSEGRRRS